VFVIHGRWFITSRAWPLVFLKKFAGFGWMGVDLFFVLSGFLITGGLLRAKGKANYFREFYWKRTLRIFPLYYFVAIGMLFSAPFWRHIQAPISPHQAWYLLYLQNWIDPFTPFTDLKSEGHFWSLAIEEQFYLAWPLCVYRVGSSRALIRVCLAGMTMAFILRTILVWHSASEIAYKNSFARIDALLIGALAVTIALRSDIPAKVQRILLPTSITLVGVTMGVSLYLHQAEYSSTTPFMQSFGYTLVAVGFGCLLLWLYQTRGERHKWNQMLSISLLDRVGRYSYGLYVYHIPIMTLVSWLFYKVGHRSGYSGTAWGFLSVATSLLVSYAVASISFRYLESPFLRLKHRERKLGRAHDVLGPDSVAG
jgi:peptidoglycan/LPS O-acetylase OafA/YrhL